MRVDNLAAYLLPDEERTCEGEFRGNGLHVFCVCDGIGGECMGGLAAMNALSTVDEVVKRVSEDATPMEIALCAADAAQRSVCKFYRRIGMIGGTTIAILALRDAEFAFLNIGDSPAFHYSAENGRCVELSSRHNLAEERKRRGLPYLPDDASYLTAYLGSKSRAKDMAHTVSGVLRDGDAILLCTDGVSNAYDPECLREAMRRGDSAKNLTDRASAARHADNCTAICLRF